MTNREKLRKQYDNIVGKQIDNGDEAEDMYPIMGDLLAYAFYYVPMKVIKRIIERNKNDR